VVHRLKIAVNNKEKAMKETSELIKEFVDFNKNASEKLQELKEKTGKKMIGWTCNYVPTELILAAGMIPVRLLSRPYSITLADASLQSFACNISRSYLDQLLKGQLKYLDGIVTPKVCDCLWMGHDIQKRHNCCTLSHYIQMPGEVASAPSKIWWENDLVLFKKALEDFGGKEITDQSLKEAIELTNTTRRLLKKLYDLRKESNPPLYGHQVLEVVLAGMMAPTEEYNVKVEQLLNDLSGTEKISKEKVRLMVIGSSIDFTEMEMLEEFEKTGGVFVTDDMCTGTRWIYREVETNKDPFGAIVDRYHYSGFCAAKYPTSTRFENIKKLAKEYKVQGAVVILEKFCDPFGFANPDTEKMLKEMGIPTLMLESAEVGALGQARTRAQGFFEMIKGV
jgi:benzoyl-CoA reductase subunit C